MHHYFLQLTTFTIMSPGTGFSMRTIHDTYYDQNIGW